MSNTTATIIPTAPAHDLWGSGLAFTGDRLTDCVTFAREALAHVGFGGFEDSPYEDVVACHEGGVPVTVAVLPLPTEAWEMTLADLEALIDDGVVEHGASLCIGRALLSDVPLPAHLRFDVMGVCMNPEIGHVRVRHLRGVWQS